jgi:hypothetical protein
MFHSPHTRAETEPVSETGWCETNWIHLAQHRDQRGGSCVCGNEPPNSITFWEIFSNIVTHLDLNSIDLVIWIVNYKFRGTEQATDKKFTFSNLCLATSFVPHLHLEAIF